MKFVLGFAAVVLLAIALFARWPNTSAKHRADPSDDTIGGKALVIDGDTIKTIDGKAFVIDGDTIKVSGERIRLAGLDAPEVDQVAQHQNGHWIRQGQRVKRALIEKIGGKIVSVTVEGYDKYNRVLGTVTRRGEDIGEWLVRNGYAVAAYGEQYEYIELEARRARRGMWSFATSYDPRTWRHEIRDNARSR